MLELIVAVFKTGSAAVANLLVNAITVKIIALVTGPAGVGVWSLLRQCQQSAVAVGTGNGGVSLIRGISQLSGADRSQFLRTVATTYLMLGTAVAIALILLSEKLAVWVGTLNAHIFALLAIPVVVGVLRDYLIAVLNGFRAIGRLALAQVFGTVASALMAYPVARLVADHDYAGFVFLMLLVALVSSMSAIYFIRRSGFELNLAARPYWTSDSFRRFATLAGVMATIGIVAAIALLIARVLIVKYRGMAAAGFFDVAWSLGLTYVGLILNAFGTYYFPKLSAMQDHEQLDLIRQVAKLTIIFMTPLIVLMTIVKPWIVVVFYSSEFMPALGIFQLILVADYIKMSTWVFSIVVIARGLERPFLIGNLLWDTALLLGIWLVLLFELPIGSIGLVIICLNSCGLIGYHRLIRRQLAIHFSARMRLAWMAGLVCVLASTAAAWDATKVDLVHCWLQLSAACMISFLCLSKSDLAAMRQYLSGKVRK